MWAKGLHSPCVPGGPKSSKGGRNQKWPAHSLLRDIPAKSITLAYLGGPQTPQGEDGIYTSYGTAV